MKNILNILEVKNLSYSFGNNPILKDINIHVNENEIVAIVGSSGVGKSTLFNLIAGVLKKQTGEITINGSDDYIGKVAYMLQKDLLFEHKTIINNVILPLIIAKVNKKKALEEGNKILKQFNLDRYANKYPQQLSGGMRQRVALIRTYMFKRKIFLLDEAFSALDAITKKELHKWYLDLKKEFNLTTLLITHDIEEAVFLSDRIYILGNKPGEIIGEIKIEINPNEDIDVQRLFYKKEILNIMNIE
ncbi:ABC transporter, ATP-binding protein [Fusobacterium nucleatum]|uniref:ABC transporter, ATP-binding protein n=1 Tax=Fusobacterium nucleatum TaxID=851 RepID=A0A133NF54_FUSNU|nr:ABC transporter ATP-binding protein [Fusobacterium nucleatum]KXA14922.1 ABC transporter, ATP-binding protein [Fusobacterium nucleatum]